MKSLTDFVKLSFIFIKAFKSLFLVDRRRVVEVKISASALTRAETVEAHCGRLLNCIYLNNLRTFHHVECC